MNRVQRSLVSLAPWTGMAALVYVVGGAIWLQWMHVIGPASSPGSAALGGLGAAAWVSVGAGAISVGSGRVSAPVFALSGGLLAWLGSGWPSALLVTGEGYTQSAQVMVVCVGMALAVATVPAMWVATTLVVLGVAYIDANYIALWSNFYSTGAQFPGVGLWQDGMFGVKSTPPYRPSWAPDPVGFVDRLRVFLSVDDLSAAESPETPQRDYSRYFQLGLAGNANATGNTIAVVVAFLTALAVRGHGSGFGKNGLAVVMVRLSLACFAVVPGFALLLVIDARAALAGCIAAMVALGVNLRWTLKRRWFAWAFSVAALLIVMTPFLLSRAIGISFSQRACVWEDWLKAMRGMVTWGIAPPGQFEAAACASVTGGFWTHAHNELLQAWSLGGILGFIAALATFGGLARWAMRYHDRDDRVLLALIVCCAVLFGFEVLSSPLSDWVRPSLALFVVIASRSLQLMAKGSVETGSVGTVSADVATPSSRHADSDLS